MKCFRVVDPEFSAPADLLSGVGAQKGGGRWSKQGRRALNTSTTLEAAIAEKAFYRLVPQIEQFMNQAVGGRKPPGFFWKNINGIVLKLAEIEFNDGLQLAKLSESIPLSEFLTAARLPPRSLLESRYSPYDLLPGRWTQEVSEHVFKTHHGIEAMSARSNLGTNVIWFPEKLDQTQVNVANIEDIFLFPCDSTGKKAKNQKNLVKDKVYVVRSHSQFSIDVLNFSLPP